MNGMTGFGEANVETVEAQLTVRVHGVNHRYLDIVVRVPDELRFADGLIRERVGGVVRRGRCEIAVSARRVSEPRAEVEIRGDAVAALHEAVRPLVDAGLVRAELSLGDLLRHPALLRLESAPASWGGDDLALLLRTVDQALARFASARAADGAKTRTSLLALLHELALAAASLREGLPAATARLATQLRARFAELAQETGWSEERWLHEAALLAEKADVREEIERFAAHLAELRETVEGTEGSGRRIDFLAQELLRELNTLAAKCRDVGIVQRALAARLLCEQIREQAQNVE